MVPSKLQLKGYPLLTRVAVGFLKSLSRFLYRPQYLGLENIPDQGPFIILGNHQSNFDVLLVHVVMPSNSRWLAKKELFQVPVLKQFITSLKAIPIDRAGVNIAGIREIRRAVKNGDIVGLFPEATRVKPEDAGSLLMSDAVINLLLRTEAPRIPFAIERPCRLFRRNRVVFGQNFYFTASEKADKELAKLKVMQEIYGLLGDLPPLLQKRIAERTQDEFCL